MTFYLKKDLQNRKFSVKILNINAMTKKSKQYLTFRECLPWLKANIGDSIAEVPF